MASLKKIFTAKYGYHFAQRCGRLRRSNAERGLRRIADRRIDHFPGDAKVPASQSLTWGLAMLLGRRGLPEACRSIASFVRYVGQPKKLLLASDGSLDAAMTDAALRAAGLRSPIEFVVVNGSPLGLSLSSSAAGHPMMKKLVLMTDLIPHETLPMLYADSDIVFFPPASGLNDLLSEQAAPGYMLDALPAFDERMFRVPEEMKSPVNGGLLWFPRPLCWERARERLSALGRDFVPTHFTEQAAVHMAMHDSGAVAFDPARFVLSLSDQFEWRDRFAGASSVICRHYVSSIRHKMWVLPDLSAEGSF